jgi:anthranilate phosphoribosyltransferase
MVDRRETDEWEIAWPELLATVTSGRDLTFDQAHQAMAAVLTGSVDSLVLSGLLIGLRTKGESIEELSGFAHALRDSGRSVPYLGPVIDTCGTGGDRRQTINVSTTAALIVAGAGGVVCKHGGRASSSLSGSADVLERLGVTIELGPDAVAQCLSDAGIGFCYAPTYYPAMANAVPVRRALKVPTAFNFLGPLINPAKAQYQIVGISDPKLVESVVGVLRSLGTIHALVVYGEDGLDELSTTGVSHVTEVTNEGEGEYAVRRYTIEPSDFGLTPKSLGELKGGDVDSNAADLLSTLEGVMNAKTEIALLNAAGGLYAAGLVVSLVEGFEVARESLRSGAAATALAKLIESSKRLAAHVAAGE